MDTSAYKKRLLEEKEILTEQLKAHAVENPSFPSDWIPDVKEEDSEGKSISDVSEKMTKELSNTGIVNDLEVRLANVLIALDKIEYGSFGICEISKCPIEKERLDANPAARTCIKHKENDLSIA